MGCKNEIASSHFKTDSENWSTKADAQGDFATPTNFSEDGVVDGYIHSKDNATGGFWHFLATENNL